MNIFVKGRPAACSYTLDKYIYGLIPSACKEVSEMGKRFAERDRHKLEFALKAKMPVKEISKQLGFSKVAIYAEIKKGTVKQLGRGLKEQYVYLADAGQRMHDERKKHCGAKKKYLPDAPLLQEITSLILDCRYSPEAAILKLRTAAVCTKTIYNYVHAGYLPGVDENKLPYCMRKKKQEKKTGKRKYMSNHKSIEERPKEILQRNTYGHWEMDTVYSSKDDLSCLLVLSERMSRNEIVIQIPDRTCGSVIKGLNRLERKLGAPTFRDQFRTITCDNGMEFADSNAIEKSCLNKGKRTTLYYCHPYSSAERGTNENQNKLIRRWIPKGDDIGLYSPEEIKMIESWMNDYPRKMFGGLSANEFKRLYAKGIVKMHKKTVVKAVDLTPFSCADLLIFA